MLTNKMIYHMNNGESIILDGKKEKINIKHNEEQGMTIVYVSINDSVRYIFPKDNVCFMERY